MKMIILVCFAIGLFACKGKETLSDESSEPEKIPVVLSISDAILNPQEEILLSELADSISYIPLETKKECLLGSYPIFSFTSNYIAYCNYCFDWTGKFLFKVGKRGQGPGEEPAEIIDKVTFNNNKFYTCGQKIIEYDSLGFFTGKELSLHSGDKVKGTISNKSLAWIVAFKSSQGNLLLYNYPDTVFIVNKNLEFISKHSIMPSCSPFYLSGSGPYTQYMSLYKEDILLHNPFMDTVFQISGTKISPRWIIKYDDLKLPEEVLYNFDKMYAQAAKDYTNNQLDNTPLSKAMDHKYQIININESKNYIFMIVVETIAFRKLRGLPDSTPMFIYYNKKTKEIKSTKKIRDDLTGYPNFFPKLGLEGERMIDFFWPYDQEEWLRKKAETDPRFKSFKGRDFSEDNPIIVVVHLKPDIKH